MRFWFIGFALLVGCSDTVAGPETWSFDEVPSQTRSPRSPATERVCDEQPLELRTVDVAGRLDVDGRISFDAHDWTITFVDRKTGGRHTFDVGDDRTYSGQLAASQFDVSVTPSDLDSCEFACAAALGTVDVNTRATFEHAVTYLSIDGMFQLDNGGVEPPTEPSAHLEFRDVDSLATYRATVSRGDDGSWAVILPAGSYDVTWHVDGPDAALDALPIGVGRLGTFDFSEPQGTVDLRLASVELSGEVTVGGLPMPDDPRLDGPRADVTFTTVDAGVGHWRIPIGERGRARFSTRILPGDYWVSLSTNDAARQSALVPGTLQSLCGEQKCRFGQNDTEWTVDVPAWLAETPVSIDGTTGDIGCGRLGFLERASQWRSSGTVQQVESPDGSGGGYPHVWIADVDARGEFAAQLPRTNYDIVLWRRASLCDDGPVGTTILAQDAPLTGEPLVLDVQGGRVQGELTVNGAVMPDNTLSSDSRGQIEFRAEDGAVVVVPLGASGAVDFDVNLLPGRYTAVLETGYVVRGRTPYVQDVLPPGRRVLAEVVVQPNAVAQLRVDLSISDLDDVVLRAPGAGTVELSDQSSGDGYVFEADAEGRFTGKAYRGVYRVVADPSGTAIRRALLSECYVVD